MTPSVRWLQKLWRKPCASLVSWCLCSIAATSSAGVCLKNGSGFGFGLNRCCGMIDLIVRFNFCLLSRLLQKIFPDLLRRQNQIVVRDWPSQLFFEDDLFKRCDLIVESLQSPPCGGFVSRYLAMNTSPACQ